ncbi:MAG: T9SS type A sorting domain-containing protein, partial [Flavisolibacter sp.]
IRWDYLADANRKHLHDVFSSLIKLRFHPLYKDVFISGATSSSLANAFKWIRVSSASDTSDLVAVGNFDVNPQTGTVTFPTAGTWYEYLNNTLFTSTGTTQNISLQPGEYHVYVNRNLNNLNATPVTQVPWNGTDLQVNLYPNPAVSDFIMDLTIPESGTSTIELYNSSGQFIKTIYSGFLTKGSRELTVRKPVVQGGIYYIKVKTKTAVKTIKVTL